MMRDEMNQGTNNGAMILSRRTAVWLVIIFNIVLAGIGAVVLSEAAPVKAAKAETLLAIGLFALNAALFFAIARIRRDRPEEQTKLPAIAWIVGVIYGCGALYGVIMVALGQLEWPYLGGVAFSGFIAWKFYSRAIKNSRKQRTH